MAIKFEKIEAGMTLYYRYRQKMGNTTLSTIVQGAVKVLEVDAEGRRFKTSGGGRERWQSARFSSGYFSWSMYDKSVAELTRGMCDAVTKVTKKKAPRVAKAAP